MRQNTLLIFFILLVATLSVTTANAGGPGFDKDVYNWNKDKDDDGYSGGYGDDDDGYGGGHGDDDDGHGWGDDDDGYGHGDDDDGYGHGDDDDGYGHGDDDDGHGWGDDDDDGNEVPLDGGLSFLALAGAGLGIKKARDNMAKNKQKKTEK